MINFKIEKFEGPLSLLLKLIEKEEVDITQVSLAKITDQFIDYIRASDNIHPEEMADFLLMASRLLFIKSRALLPFIFPEEEVEEDNLELQLKMYKEFLDATKKIEKVLGKNKFMYIPFIPRKVTFKDEKKFYPPNDLKVEDLKNIFEGIAERVRPIEKIEEETLDHKINIEEKILSIQQTMLNRLKVSFNHFMSQAKSKTEVVVSFLAMLELVKQRDIHVTQDTLFSDILIHKK